jgi:hypothetical protein
VVDHSAPEVRPRSPSQFQPKKIRSLRGAAPPPAPTPPFSHVPAMRCVEPRALRTCAWSMPARLRTNVRFAPLSDGESLELKRQNRGYATAGDKRARRAREAYATLVLIDSAMRASEAPSRYRRVYNVCSGATPILVQDRPVWDRSYNYCATSIFALNADKMTASIKTFQRLVSAEREKLRGTRRPGGKTRRGPDGNGLLESSCVESSVVRLSLGGEFATLGWSCRNGLQIAFAKLRSCSVRDSRVAKFGPRRM